MIVTYDFTLIMISVAVSIIGSHSTLAIMSRGGHLAQVPYRLRMVFAAFVFGGSIWAMHFIGMLALHLPVPTFYAVMETLASALIAIMLTGLGLYAATSGRIRAWSLEIGAVLMGAGIVSMHYLGMSAIRSTCIITYSPAGIVGASVVAVVASWLAMRVVNRRPRLRRSRLWASVLLGVAISGMHYVAMAGTTFSIAEDALLIAVPVLDKYYLASLVLVLAFLLFDVFVFIVMPEAREGGFFGYGDATAAGIAKPRDGQTVAADAGTAARVDAGPAPINVDPAPQGQDEPLPEEIEESRQPAADPASATNGRLTIKTIRGGMRFVDIGDLLFVAAEGHYTSVGMVQGQPPKFERMLASSSLSQFLTELPEEQFCQVHRSYVVNLAHVKEVVRRRDSAHIRFVFDDVPQVSVSRSRLKSVLERLTLGGFAYTRPTGDADQG